MTRRDFKWRALGALLVGGGAVASHLNLGDANLTALTAAVGIAGAMAGLVLLVQGKRVPQIFTVERGGHRDLPLLLALRRSRRGR